MKTWSSLGYVLVMCLTGCGESVTLVQDSGDGGIVVYPFKGEQGSMLSSFRKEALAAMADKCGGSYTILREGEAKGRRAMVAGAVQGSQEVLRERRWGIEFRCK